MATDILEEMYLVFLNPEDYDKRLKLASENNKRQKLRELKVLNQREFKIHVPIGVIKFLLMDKRGMRSLEQEKKYKELMKND